ncbi:MAG: twin-arginine translocase TatA/TatE family subunit [Flavobacteriales bacterium]|nr:MAG: twin-arginine translocase TatA/TatE family subunit [Flavobacteriales bacterium]
MGGIGFKEILVIALIIIILFGAKRIPDLMKGLGKGIKDFKDASKGEDGGKEEVK